MNNIKNKYVLLKIFNLFNFNFFINIFHYLFSDDYDEPKETKTMEDVATTFFSNSKIKKGVEIKWDVETPIKNNNNNTE